MLLWSRGLLRARSRFPEIVRNIRKRSKGMESLARGLVLAKQRVGSSNLPGRATYFCGFLSTTSKTTLAPFELRFAFWPLAGEGRLAGWSSRLRSPLQFAAAA